MTAKDKTRFEIVSSIAVVTSVAIMAIETFDLPPGLKHALYVADITLSLAFVAEYLFRIASADNKRRYLTSFYGLIDLIALLPLLTHAAASTRVVRMLRLLRLLRLLKLQRYTRALDRFGDALKLITAEAMLFAGVALGFITAFAFLIYEVEHEAQPEIYSNIFDSIWWAVVSLTSVGYGDVYPVTTVGRLLTLAMVLTGMGIVAVPTALLASALSQVARNETEQ